MSGCEQDRMSQDEIRSSVVNTIMNFRVPKSWVNSWSHERLSASIEGLCSVESMETAVTMTCRPRAQ
jgi:hypothetical protein